MRQTRFIVLSMKKIIKISLLCLGAVLIIAILVSMLKKDTSSATINYTPGEYSSTLTLENTSQPLYLTVVLTEDSIKDIYISDLTEDQKIFYPLISSTLESVKNEVIKNQNTQITLNQDTMETSKFLLNAVEDAINQGVILE
ncbi:MAG: hypothetical protein ACK5LV_09740 [Lachnospirales bacterium]